MDNKKKELWIGFFINMLGVILAIALTFGVNSLWMRNEYRKRTKEMLILVRNELKDNKDNFKRQEQFLQNNGSVYKIILEAKKDMASIPPDSLKAYHTQIGDLRGTTLTTSAWQIFQNSEMIQKMTNKELLIRLTECYSLMEMLMDFILKDYWDVKKKMLTTLDLDDPSRFFDAVLKNNEYVYFFNLFSLDNNDMWLNFITLDAMIDYTVMLMDKHGDYRYDMAEKDEELSSFIKERIESEFQQRENYEN